MNCSCFLPLKPKSSESVELPLQSFTINSRPYARTHARTQARMNTFICPLGQLNSLVLSPDLETNRLRSSPGSSRHTDDMVNVLMWHTYHAFSPATSMLLVLERDLQVPLPFMESTGFVVGQGGIFLVGPRGG